MVADVAGEPGALPLLQYALTELFERRQDHALTLQSYREIGGVSGAVAARAEELYEAASDAGREAAQQLFLRLVTLGEGTEETRRRVARAELDSLEVDQAALEQVIDAFGRHRLLSFDRDPLTRAPTVEVAHEALLHAWGRLRGWIEAAREDLRLHRRLAAETREWESSGREASFLLRGTRLDLFEPWWTTSGLALARAEREYLEASLAQRDVERDHEEARKARERALERRSVSRLRALVAVLAVAALVAAGLTLFAFDQREEARDEARVSFARELASAALANLDEDPERSILLALEAVNATGSGGTVLREAEEALHAAVQSSRVVRSLPGSAVRDRGMFVSVSPDGSRLASIGDDGKAAVWDVASGDKLFSLEDRVMSVAFSSDASRLATGGEDRIAKLWNAATGKELMAFSGSGRGVVGIAFSRDGTRLATSALAGLVKVWSTETGRRLAAVAAGAATGLAFNANGTLLITTDTTAATVWDLSTERALRRLDAPAFDVAVSPDGSLAALVGLNGLTGLWNPVTGEQLRSLSGHRGHVGSVEFSADGRTFATGGDDGTVRVWDAKTGTELIVLAGQGSAVGTVALDRDGTRVAACCGGGRAMVWDTTPQGSRGSSRWRVTRKSL
jgi:WD40 repeat protein